MPAIHYVVNLVSKCILQCIPVVRRGSLWSAIDTTGIQGRPLNELPLLLLLDPGKNANNN